MRLTRVTTNVALCLALAHAGCSSFAERDACLDKVESLKYVARLRQSIDREWKRPLGVGGGQVIVTGRVNRKGELRRASIDVSTANNLPCRSAERCSMVSEPLARSMEEALRRAEPIGPPPEAAACMLSRTVELVFQSSDRYIPDPESELR